ncbi:MAG: tetratricopeptide repeat protein [Acidobacteriota bacterium]|nr:tetratricopeptide repeat protein [Acidobacteriota bacterium]
MLPLGLLLVFAFQPDTSMLRTLYEEKAVRVERQYGPNDAHTADAWRDLGLFLRQWATPADARDALRKVLAIDEAGAATALTLADAANLARVSPPPDAQPLWTRVTESQDPSLVSEAFAALGDMRDDAGDKAGAADFYRKALDREQANSGPDSAKVAVRLNSLALVLGPREAVPLLQRALGIDRRVWGEKHPETATTEVNLSGELQASGRFTEAVQIGVAALANFEATLGDNHPRTAAAASTLADGYRALKQNARAEKLYRQALAIDERAYGPSHPETLDDVRNLVEFLRDTGRAAEAKELETRLH